jgi:hypothetical protein
VRRRSRQAPFTRRAGYPLATAGRPSPAPRRGRLAPGCGPAGGGLVRPGGRRVTRARVALVPVRTWVVPGTALPSGSGPAARPDLGCAGPLPGGVRVDGIMAPEWPLLSGRCQAEAGWPLLVTAGGGSGPAAAAGNTY